MATVGQRDYDDLHSGMRWLLNTIVSNYRKIHNQNEYFLSFGESSADSVQRKDSLMTARSLTGRRTRVSDHKVSETWIIFLIIKIHEYSNVFVLEEIRFNDE